MRKVLVAGIIFLFIGLSVTSSLGISNLINDNTPPVTTHALDPPVPDGLNDYYVCNVTVTLEATDDLSGVKEIKYRINDDPVVTIPGDNGTFLITEDSNLHTVIYWAIDNVGNTESQNCFQLKMDQTPPDVNLSYEINPWPGWYIIFRVEAIDATSGMERVEFKINGMLQDTVSGPGPVYEWGCSVWWLKINTFGVTCCDFAGNCVDKEIEFKSIKNRFQQLIHPLFLLLIQWFLSSVLNNIKL